MNSDHIQADCFNPGCLTWALLNQVAPYSLPVGGVFIPSHCSVWKAHTRHGEGGSEWPCQYSALRGSDKAGMGWERRQCVRECWRGGAGGVTLSAMRPDLNL